MLLEELVRASSEVSATRSRKAKRARLAALLRALAQEEQAIGVSYLTGALPQGRVGIGWALVREASEAKAAEAASLALLEVHGIFDALASEKGAGSAARRRALLRDLFSRATQEEQRFLALLVLGEVRQGALAGVMIEAVADAAGLEPDRVRSAAMLAGSVTEVAVAALREGESALLQYTLTLFAPVLPMLASPTDDVESALARLGEASFERKLDGARVQVHKDGEVVRVYSRRLHDVTASVPEVVEAARSCAARSLILDGEAIALDADGAPHPFQITMRRFGRTHDVAAMREALPLATFFFDVLYADGVSLLDTPARERAEILTRLAPAAHHVERIVTRDPEEAEAFFDRTIAAGHEGLMAKDLGAPYAAGSRGFAWLKVKPAHTLDLVVIAVERGSGRRSGWLSNLHLAARDEARGELVMLGKTFKGMSDELLAWQTERLGALAIRTDGHVVHVRPELVVEIALADVQDSPQYPAGLALRFARVKRYRPDKGVAEASTLDEVRAIRARGHRG